MPGPGEHPEPPDDLATRDLPLLETNSSWFRIYPVERDPIHFGRTTRWRFDAPDAGYGVMYLAADEYAAFIETFAHTTGTNIVTASSLAAKNLARISSTRTLRFVDLVSEGLARIGADGRLCTGDYGIAQRWSRALHGHRSEPDGIYYRCRHDPARFACALFDRAVDAVSAEPLGSLLTIANGELLGQILDQYGFALLDD